MKQMYDSIPAQLDRTIILLLFCVSANLLVSGQALFPDLAPIYRDDVVPRIDITLPEDSLEAILAPGNEKSDYHYRATFRFDNGEIQETIENIGFRLRSYFPSSA